MSQGSESTPATLRDRVDDLEDRVDALSTWQDTTRTTIWDLEEELDALQADIQRLNERLDDIAATAEQAMTVASRGHDADGKSQTQAAKEVTRDELVRRAGKGVTGPARKVTITEIADIVDREYGTEPAWAVVNRAWSQLTDEWPQFDESRKDGNKAMRVRADHITTALARTVETSLDRDDLAKRFGGAESTGGDAE
jgi:regulator of replication initiation timing